MISKISLSTIAFVCIAASGSLAIAAVVFGRQVNYLDYLSLFNAMAAGMLLLSIAGAAFGFAGVCQSKGRAIGSWVGTLTALSLTAFYVFNP